MLSWLRGDSQSVRRSAPGRRLSKDVHAASWRERYSVTVTVWLVGASNTEPHL